MTFRNSVVGGTTLVRPAIQSPNYVTGVSGWAIKRDGSAEFNNIVIRGSTTTQGLLLFYNGTPAAGNLIGSISPTAGTDAFGNAYPAGFQMQNNTSHRYVQLSTLGNISLNDTDEWNNAASLSVQASLASAGFSTILQSASNNSGSGTDPTAMTLDPGDVSNNGTVIFQSPLSTVDVDMELTGQITRYNGNGFTSYTPTVTGGGAATFSTLTGYWQRLGPMIFFNAYFVVGTAGSGALNVAITGPVDIDRSARQTVFAHCDNITPALEGDCAAVSFVGGTGATFDRLRGRENTNVTGADLLAGAIVIVEGWYREA